MSGFSKRLFNIIVKKPIQRFNVDNRAAKVVKKMDQGDVTTAPKHPGTEELIDKMKAAHPEAKEAQKLRHAGLHERLEGMVVNPDKVDEPRLLASRPLPQREYSQAAPAVDEYDLGYSEPAEIPQGRCTLKQAMNFIEWHMSDPEVFRPDVIAQEYNIPESDVRSVLDHFKVMNVQQSDTETVVTARDDARKAMEKTLGAAFGTDQRIPEPQPPRPGEVRMLGSSGADEPVERRPGLTEDDWRVIMLERHRQRRAEAEAEAGQQGGQGGQGEQGRHGEQGGQGRAEK